jgi:hypothetical protein
VNRSQWVNTEPDEGAPHALLDRVTRHLPVDIIDGIWMFPARRAGGVESTVLVITALCEDAERRRVWTAHFSVTRDKKGRPSIQERLEEHALAPAHAVGRAVDGVLRRLGDELSRPPRAEAIGGLADRWQALLIELGAPPPRAAPAADADSLAEAAPAAETVAGDRSGPVDEPG